MRGFGAKARIRVLGAAGDVPIAGQDDATIAPQLAAEVQDLRLKAALESVPVAQRGPLLVVVRLRRTVDGVYVDNREACLTDHDDASLEIPGWHLATPFSANERGNTVHAAATKGYVARVARQREVAAIAR